MNYQAIPKPASYYIGGLVKESRISSALAMELRLSCTERSIQHMIAEVSSARG